MHLLGIFVRVKNVGGWSVLSPYWLVRKHSGITKRSTCSSADKDTDYIYTLHIHSPIQKFTVKATGILQLRVTSTRIVLYSTGGPNLQYTYIYTYTNPPVLLTSQPA
jgi:hypothetical protein